MFDTAQEYLEYLQIICTKEYALPFEKHPNFTKLNKEDLEALSLENFDGFLLLESLIEKYKEAIINTVSVEIKEKMQESLAIGLVRNGSFNATCSKSSNDKYAILIYEGLFVLLNKHGKLTHAARNPKIVRFCNRGDKNSLSSSDYHSYISELFDNYNKYHYPIGALVKLERNYSNHMFTIMLSELFTICHEIGHFLNGDFEKDSHFLNLTNLPFKGFNENLKHEIEYNADLTAFPIFEKAAMNLFPIISKDMLVVPLSIFFAIMGTITKSKSESHPPPYKRMVNILAICYSEKVALDYIASFESKEKTKHFFSQFE